MAQTAWLGDLVLTLPALRELRRARPDARVVVLTTPAGAELLAADPAVDTVLAYRKRGWDRGVSGLPSIVSLLRRERFDVALAAQRSFRTGLLVRLSGARLRVGFEGAAGGWAYNRTVRWDPARHATERFLALVAPAGGNPDADSKPTLGVVDAARASVSRKLERAGLPAGQPYVALAPGSVWPTKRWTTDGFVGVGRWARERGLAAVLVGSASDRDVCLGVERALGDGATSLAGETTLPELCAVLAGAAAAVSNDSGAAHVAAAVGTPVVTVFGPTVPAFGFAPRGPASAIVEIAGLDCRPCHRHGPRSCPLGHLRCMRDIGVERVVGVLAPLLGRGRAVG